MHEMTYICALFNASRSDFCLMCSLFWNIQSACIEAYSKYIVPYYRSYYLVLNDTEIRCTRQTWHTWAMIATSRRLVRLKYKSIYVSYKYAQIILRRKHCRKFFVIGHLLSKYLYLGFSRGLAVTAARWIVLLTLLDAPLANSRSSNTWNALTNELRTPGGRQSNIPVSK